LVPEGTGHWTRIDLSTHDQSTLPTVLFASSDVAIPNGLIHQVPITEEATMRSLTCLLRHEVPVARTYKLADRLHQGRIVYVTADEIIRTVSSWLAELGAYSPLVDDLARNVRSGDWPAAYAIADHLSIEVSLAA
jgi:hypothetical protein